MRRNLIKEQLNLLNSSTGIGFIFTNKGRTIKSNSYVAISKLEELKKLPPLPFTYTSDSDVLEYSAHVHSSTKAGVYVFKIGDSSGSHFVVETTVIPELLFERHKEVICRSMMIIKKMFEIIDELENKELNAIYIPKAHNNAQLYNTTSTLKATMFTRHIFCACRINILNTKEILSIYGDKTLSQAKDAVFRMIHTYSKDVELKLREDIQFVENDGILVIFETLEQAKTVLNRLEEPLANVTIDNFVVTIKLGASLVQFPMISDTAKIANLLLKGINYLSDNFSDILNIVDMHSEVGENILKEYKLSEDLRTTVTKNKDEILVLYQPKVDTETGRVVGAEGLVRWNNQERGLVPPNEFIPISERTGLIKELGRLVLDTVIEDSKRLNSTLSEKIRLGVNVSAIQLEDEAFVDYLESKIESGECDPKYIDIEVTESVGMFDINHTIDLLSRLSKTGVTISLDDFGTGYSSLTYVKNLPLNYLKIDKSFVDSIFEETSFCQNIIDISKKIHLLTVAEGVETKEQWDLLKEFGCDILQGYYFSKPIRYEELVEKIKTLNGEI